MACEIPHLATLPCSQTSMLAALPHHPLIVHVRWRAFLYEAWFTLWECDKYVCLVSTGHQASLLVPLLSIHDVVNNVCLRLHNAVNDPILDCILGLHVKRPLHVLQQKQKCICQRMPRRLAAALKGCTGLQGCFIIEMLEPNSMLEI